jgi:hypothetical protein
MSKALWRILLLAVAAVALWRSALAGKGLLDYYRLDARVPAVETKWEFAQLAPAKYALVSRYTYRIKGKEYFGMTQWGKPYYLNELSAQEEAKRRTEEPWKVWINRENYKTSSLQRAFPFMDLFYAICTLTIFGYFVFLKLHLSRISNKM